MSLALAQELRSAHKDISGSSTCYRSKGNSIFPIRAQHRLPRCPLLSARKRGGSWERLPLSERNRNATDCKTSRSHWPASWCEYPSLPSQFQLFVRAIFNVPVSSHYLALLNHDPDPWWLLRFLLRMVGSIACIDHK